MKINLKKSELILIERVSNIDLLVEKVGCKVGSLSSTYLRMPQGAHFNFESVLDGVEERFKKRLALWKR